MAKKAFQKEMNKMIAQVKVNLQKLGKDAGVIAKKGEKEFVKASRIGRIQLDITRINLLKEKMYYEMGKKAASVRNKKQSADEVLKPFFEKLRKMETEVRTKKREISGVRDDSSKE